MRNSAPPLRSGSGVGGEECGGTCLRNALVDHVFGLHGQRLRIRNLA